jgi:two-component system cell cycle response regulator DivK
MQREAAPKTVLVVEDNELNMKLFQDLLQIGGYNVLCAREVAPALELTRQHRPDLIVLDIQLPGASGLELTRRIKGDDALKAIPILAVTALALKGDEQKIRAAGCDGYISKPISMVNFLGAVERFFR